MGILKMWAVQLPGSGKAVASVSTLFDTSYIALSTIASVSGNAAQSGFNYNFSQNGNMVPVRVKNTLAKINSAIASGAAYVVVAG